VSCLEIASVQGGMRGNCSLFVQMFAEF